MSIAFVDGGCYGNHEKDGPRSAYGSYKLIQENGDVIHACRFELLSARSNNEAEYLSLIRLLEDPHLEEGSTILTDSALLVGQLEKGWRVRAEHLKQFHQRAQSLLHSKRAILRQVPRAEIEEKLGH